LTFARRSRDVRAVFARDHFEMVPHPLERNWFMSAFDLTGRVALVTGGNGGIGLGMAKGLAEAGAAVAIAGRNRVKADKALAELGPRAIFVEADVTDEASVNAMVGTVVDRLGRLDIVVNNAGGNDRKKPQDYTLAEFTGILTMNLTSAFMVSQAAFAHLKAGGHGKIINIGSMMSIFGGPMMAPYAASKGGLVQLTKVCATAWAADNIQVNAILPGWIETDLTARAKVQLPGLNERVLARTPAGRWGKPDDFAGIAVFLASSASDFVSGAAIPVDGAFSVNA
jgi:2-dehydro-3-deoxy-D-gluconate 5-dehydrogenase